MALRNFHSLYHHTASLPEDDLNLNITLKIEAAWVSETLGPYHITARRHSPENHNLNLHLTLKMEAA
jgi:hypothetical protein